MRRLALALALGIPVADNSRAMTIGSAAPGNVFVTGEPIVFTVTGVAGRVTWRLADWQRRDAGAGEVTAAGAASGIALPALPPGWYELSCRDGQGERAGPQRGRCHRAISAWRASASP